MAEYRNSGSTVAGAPAYVVPSISITGLGTAASPAIFAQSYPTTGIFFGVNTVDITVNGQQATEWGSGYMLVGVAGIFGSSVNVNGPLAAGDGLSVTGGASITTGGLSVPSGGGGITVASGGGATALQALTVAGSAALSAGLTVTGGATSVAALSASGALTGTAGATISGGTTSVAALTASGTLVVTGSTTPTGGIVGITNASSAAAGLVGEVITATSGAVALTSGIANSVTSIALTAGDWDIFGSAYFTAAGTTTTQYVLCGISPTSGAYSPVPDYTQQPGIGIAGGGSSAIAPTLRVNISSGATYYLTVTASFAVSTMTATGKITARRRR